MVSANIVSNGAKESFVLSHIDLYFVNSEDKCYKRCDGAVPTD